MDIEDKSHQWFGATVQSSGENGVIVVSAANFVLLCCVTVLVRTRVFNDKHLLFYT